MTLITSLYNIGSGRSHYMKKLTSKWNEVLLNFHSIFDSSFLTSRHNSTIIFDYLSDNGSLYIRPSHKLNMPMFTSKPDLILQRADYRLQRAYELNTICPPESLCNEITSFNVSMLKSRNNKTLPSGRTTIDTYIKTTKPNFKQFGI